MPAEARDGPCAALAGRYRLVACVTGRRASRRAADRRRRRAHLRRQPRARAARPGRREPAARPGARPPRRGAAGFVAAARLAAARRRRAAARGQGPDPGDPLARRRRPGGRRAARAARSPSAPREQGLVPHLGRMVLELRPVATDRQGHRRPRGWSRAPAPLEARSSAATTAPTSTRSRALRELRGGGRARARGLRRRRLAPRRRRRSAATPTWWSPGTDGLPRAPAGAASRLMLFCDLLRITVLLVAGVATALGAVGVVVANQDADEFALDGRRGWWIVAAAIGLCAGPPARAAGERSRGCSRVRAPRPACRREPRPDRVHAALADRRLRAPGRGRGLLLAAGRRDRRRLRDPDRALPGAAARTPSARSRTATGFASTSSPPRPSSRSS